MRLWARWVMSVTLALVTIGAGAAWAEDYVIGNGDVLQISVWLHPELDRTVTVSTTGTIVYPPLGDVTAAGQTPKQLGDKLGERVGSFLRQATAVTVTVTQYTSRSVSVSGAVAKPGIYGFEHIPGLIDVLTQAGGALPGADLSQVQIVRKEGEARRTLTADVASALRDGVGVRLPELKPGDAVIVPGSVTGGGAAVGDGVGVLGEVTKPGLYSVGMGQDLWAVIAVAGGPTAKGDLHRVQVITRHGGGQIVATLDLRGMLRRGARAPFVVKAGDIIFVNSTSSTARGKAWSGFQEVMAVSHDLLNLVVLRDVLRRNNP